MIVKVFAVVGFVGNKNYGEFGATQDISYVHIKVGNTILDINKEQNEVSLFGGNENLLAYLAFEDII